MGRGDPSKIVEVVAEFCRTCKLSAYEEAAIELLRNRTYQGGMLDDRQGCLTMMIMIAIRRLDKKEVRKSIDDSVEKYMVQKKIPKNLGTIPWYAFDMHTQVGKIVLSILGKRKCPGWGITKDQLAQLWWSFESSIVPPSQTQYAPFKLNPTMFESIWWIPALKADLKQVGLPDAKKASQNWNKLYREEVKGVVEWLLKKRTMDEES